jgi:DeoR family glycerol-3-phosphate regulon repressor
MKPVFRRERIIDLVRERERMAVDELAELLGSSRETIRRDLTALADRGRLRKFHGGAMLPEMYREGSFPARLSESVREKRAIARTAASLFKPGDTIFIDVGTTTLLFAEALAHQNGLTIITNGPRIGRIMAQAGSQVFVIGGEYRLDADEMVGALSAEQIARFHASHVVLTIGGLSRNGAMDYSLDEAQVARAMIAQARHVTIIADGSKLGRDALFQVCPLDAIDRLVVDISPDVGLGQTLAEAGVEVIIAEPAER